MATNIPPESWDGKSFEDYEVPIRYSNEADVYEATGFTSTFIQNIGDLTADQVTTLINNYIAKADGKIRRRLGIPYMVTAEKHRFMNNPWVQLGPDREDEYGMYNIFEPLNKVVGVYKIWYNNRQLTAPYPKNVIQFTEPSSISYWSATSGTVTSTSDPDYTIMGSGSIKASITGESGGSIEYPANHNLKLRIYPWFYIGFMFMTDTPEANFTFSMVRDTGSYYYADFTVSGQVINSSGQVTLYQGFGALANTWVPMSLNIRVMRFQNDGSEGAQPDFNWILTPTQYIKITADRPCNFWVAGINFNDGFFASAPQGYVYWCHDKETEVLTLDGWKYFKDITYDDKIATLNSKTDNLEYQAPEHITNIPYNGKMYYWDKKYSNFMVTPDHNMYISNLSQHNPNNFKLVKAKNIKLKRFKLKTKVNWNGKNEEWFYLPKATINSRNTVKKIPMEIWVKFMAWYLSEGYITGDDNHSLTAICQSKEKYLDEIENVIKETGFKYIKYTQDGINYEIRIYSKQLYDYLKQFGKSENKYIPINIKELSKELLYNFFVTYAKGDGTFAKDNVQSIYTISKRMADDLQEIILKIGKESTISIRQPQQTELNGKLLNSKLSYRIVITNHRKYRTIDNTPDIVDYNDNVYCVTVPNHIIFTRRNGQTLWSGNCMPNWYPTGLVKITYSYDPFASRVPQVVVEASSRLAGVKLIDWLLGKRQAAIAFDQMSDTLEESPDKETLENTRRRLEKEAEEAMKDIGYGTNTGIA